MSEAEKGTGSWIIRHSVHNSFQVVSAALNSLYNCGRFRLAKLTIFAFHVNTKSVEDKLVIRSKKETVNLMRSNTVVMALASLLLVASLTACGGAGGGENKPATDPPATDAAGGDPPTSTGTDAAGGDAPAADKPGGDAPAGDKPAGEAPNADADKPAADAPAGDAAEGGE